MKNIFLSLALLGISSLSLAGETYHGSYSVRTGGPGGEMHVALEYNIDFTNKDNLKGTLNIHRRGKSVCSGERSINGSSLKGDEIILTATPTEAQMGLECATIEFIGKKVGEKFIGKYTSGQMVLDLTLSK
jgi:hypothetical protein